jgi:membrane associated rhomboid family serine protease
MSDTSPSAQTSLPFGLPVVVLVLLLLNILPELTFQLSDHGILGAPGLWRHMGYLFGAFQPDLVGQQGELYPGQTLGMFLSYCVLHTNLFHLTINMMGLIWLGDMVLERRQSETFVMIYILSAIGAAEAFALLGPEGKPMVGASGALFGLLGAYLVDSGLLMPRHSANPPLKARVLRVFLITLALVLCDTASRALLGTPVAWEAHAGGFLTGAFVAMAAPARGNLDNLSPNKAK